MARDMKGGGRVGRGLTDGTLLLWRGEDVGSPSKDEAREEWLARRTQRTMIVHSKGTMP